MRVLNANFRSVVNKTDKLEDLLLKYDPHVAIITETWLHEGITDDMLIGPSHQIFRRDRVSRGGGVAIILKSTFSATLLPQIDEHESLFLKVNCWGHILTVCAAYRSPSSPSQYLSSLYRYMSSLVHKKIIMAGD